MDATPISLNREVLRTPGDNASKWAIFYFIIFRYTVSRKKFHHQNIISIKSFPANISGKWIEMDTNSTKVLANRIFSVRWTATNSILNALFQGIFVHRIQKLLQLSNPPFLRQEAIMH